MALGLWLFPPILAVEQSFDLNYLLNFGVLGFLAIAFLMGLIWPKPSVDRITAELKEAKEQRDMLLKTYEDKVIPTIADLNSTIVPALTTHTRKMEELERAVRDLVVQQGKP